MFLNKYRRYLHQVHDKFASLDNDDPRAIAARTYGLSLSLSLGPSLISLLARGRLSKKSYGKLSQLLKKELNINGFAFAMAVAVGGGAALEVLWKRRLQDSDEAKESTSRWVGMFNSLDRHIKSLLHRWSVSPYQRALICNAITALIAINLMQRGKRSGRASNPSIPLSVPIPSSERRTSRTLDLTLLLLVRALDSLIQGTIQRSLHTPSEKSSPEEEAKQASEIRKRIASMTDKLDAILFWVASARIMWCFFYKAESLPRSYVKWIGTLANVDPRLLGALRDRKKGTWTYGGPSSQPWLESMAYELGYPRSWGDTAQIPPFGGSAASAAWKRLGMERRAGIGGLPCEIAHGGIGSRIIPGGVGGSCTANVVVRGVMGFIEALAIYAPVHFLPILLRQPDKLLSLSVLKRTVLALIRSSLFLSTFISSVWAALCFTRTLVVARFLPNISHNFYDGPYGCILAGSLACGASIWIEQGKRRGEMALYVLPRALRSVLSDVWLKSDSLSTKLIERLIFAGSLASLLAAGQHHPSTLRGLSRWAILFVSKGVKAGGQKSKP